MKVLALVIAAVILGLGIVTLLAGFTPGTGGGFVMSQSLGDETIWDIDGNAVRQAGYRTEDAAGNGDEWRVTLFGPTERISPPWLHVDVADGGLVLRALDGTITPVDPTTDSLYLQGESWVAVGETVPKLEIPLLDDGRSLRSTLIESYPAHRALFERALPDRSTP